MFEAELVRRTKELMRALQVVQTDLKQLQSRDTVGAKQVDMRLYSVRSELLQQIRANTEELKNL